MFGFFRLVTSKKNLDIERLVSIHDTSKCITSFISLFLIMTIIISEFDAMINVGLSISISQFSESKDFKASSCLSWPSIDCG